MEQTAVKTNLDYLSVKDSDASSSHSDHIPIDPTNSTDVSGNTDWFSGGGGIDTKFTMNRSYYY